MTLLRYILLAWILLIVTSPSAQAEVIASPLIFDVTVSPRDMFERTIIITNNGSLPVRVFPSVNEITLDEGGSIKEFIPASVSDRSTSVTSWLAFPRGRIELLPGASTSLTVNFSINQNAQPGLYHAYIGLGNGSTRDEAELKVVQGTTPGVVVRLAIADTRVESLRLSRFTVDRIVVSETNDAVAYALTNPGDVPVVPSGEVIIYNNRGEEVSTVVLNDGGRTVAPGETVNLTAPITTGGMFGRYKAFLSLQYGNQQATVHDTAFFYVAPWHYLTALFFGIFILCLGVVFWWRRVLIPDELDGHDGHVALHIRPGAQRDDLEHDITLTKSSPPN